MSSRRIAARRRGGAGRPGGRPRVLATTALSLLLVLAWGPAADAELVDDPPAAQARLVVGDLQALVGPPAPEQPVETVDDLPPTALTARLLVENTGDRPLEGGRIVVETFGHATSRSELRAVLDGADDLLGGRGAPVHDEPLPVVAPGDVAQFTLTLDAVAADLLDDAHDVTVRPLVISVALGTVVLDEVRTAAVGVSRTVQRPVETAVVLALDGPAPATTASTQLRAVGLEPGGRLDRLVRAAEQDPALITVAPAAHTLEDLEAAVGAAVPGATSLRERILQVAASGPAGAVSSAYGLVDVPLLLDQPATSALATRAVIEGRDRLQALVGRPPGAAHLAVTAPTRASLELTPVDLLLVPWSDAAGARLREAPSQDVPGAHRSVRTPGGRTIDVLVADPWVTTLLADAGGEHGWAVDAHRIVVESAMLFAERPGDGGRPLLVLPPLGWEAPGTLPSELTRRLLDAPWLRVAPAVTVAAQAEVSTAAWNPTTDVDPTLAPVVPQLGVLEVRVDGVLSAVGAADGAADAPSEGPAVTDGEDAPDELVRISPDTRDDLLRAVSRWPSASPVTAARDALTAIAEDVDATVGAVSVPADSGITLTSERGVIPITVQHPEGAPLEVVVELATQGRLSFDDGPRQTIRIEPGSTSTVSFEATALGRGTFPLAVTVRTPERDVVLARSLVSVRATAVSRPALAVIGAVVLLLLLFGRRRRPRSPKLEVVR